MRTNLKLTMTAVAVAGLLSVNSVIASDWASYATKRPIAPTIPKDAKAVQGGLDGKRLASKGAPVEEAKGVSASVARGELCSKKDAMAKACEFHCGS